MRWYDDVCVMNDRVEYDNDNECEYLLMRNWQQETSGRCVANLGPWARRRQTSARCRILPGETDSSHLTPVHPNKTLVPFQTQFWFQSRHWNGYAPTLRTCSLLVLPGVSGWQLPVQTVTKISSKWHHFRFSGSLSLLQAHWKQKVVNLTNMSSLIIVS